MAKLSSEDRRQFIEWVSIMVQRHYKRGPLWKARLRWRLVKQWNSRWSNIGIPGRTKEILGEDEATKLFQEVAEDIMSNPDLLQAAIDDGNGS